MAIVLAAGLPNLPWPLHGDQALFLLGAEAVERGELLYRDFWDLKQPGIFAFFWAGGNLFGFTGFGVHLFELSLWALFSLFVCSTWPRLRGDGGFSLWPAVTIAGWYYAVTGSMQQTQVEVLVGPLLYVQLWLMVDRPHRGRWLLAGVLATGVLTLKLMFAPLLAVVWLFAVYRLGRSAWRRAILLTALYAVGLTAALLIVLTPWLAAGEAAEIWRTFIEYPRRMVQEIPPAKPVRLLEAAKWFAIRFAPLLILAGIGLRQMPGAWVAFFGAWILAAIGLVAAQQLSWWSYHFMLLMVPVGLLAVEGIRCMATWRRVGPFLLAALLLPGLGGVALKWRPFAAHGFCVTPFQRADYLRSEDATYRMAEVETAFLNAADARPGSIFVAGDPLFHVVSGRRPATAVHGWALELYLPGVRTRLAGELEKSTAPYVFVSRGYEELLANGYPELMAVLRRDYRLRSASDEGSWYER